MKRNRNGVSLVLKREVDGTERREEGSLYHVRGACTEKALSWGDGRLLRTFVWSLNVCNALCGYLAVLWIAVGCKR